MVRDLQILLDPPVSGVYTHKDTVSGKVIFESANAETIESIYVFFRGRVNIEFDYVEDRDESPSYRYIDKEVLFQKYQKVFDGNEKLLKKTRYDWPFTFEFHAMTISPKSLPPSGKFGKSGRCSVEYKVIAVPGRDGLTENEIMQIMNPDDSYMPRKSYIQGLTRTIASLRKKKINGIAEQQLLFVRMSPETATEASGHFSYSKSFEISSRHLPQLQQTPADFWNGLRLSRGEESRDIPFSITSQCPKTVVQGVPFSVLLSVSSPSKLWNMNPPPVTLTSFSMAISCGDTQSSGGVSHYDCKTYRIWQSGRLHTPLGSETLDIGQMHSFRLTGDGIIPSFGTRLLQRSYSVIIHLEAEVGRKSFKFAQHGHIQVA